MCITTHSDNVQNTCKSINLDGINAEQNYMQ